MRKILSTKFKNFVYWFVLLSFILPVGFLIYRIITTGSIDKNEIGYRSPADYTLMLVQCLLGAIVIHIPHFLRRYLKIEIPASLNITFIVFLYCAIFLGEVRDFYYKVPHWDKWLHGFSAIMAGSFGFIIIDLMSKSNSGIKLSPPFTALFAFYFAITIGVLWEIYEYTFDGILGLNMQKFALEDGSKLIGRAALRDTMSDIIIDCFGSVISAIIGYISLKRQKNEK